MPSHGLKKESPCVHGGSGSVQNWNRSIVLYVTKDVRFSFYSISRWMDTGISENYSEAPNHFVYLRVVFFVPLGTNWL